MTSQSTPVVGQRNPLVRAVRRTRRAIPLITGMAGLTIAAFGTGIVGAPAASAHVCPGDGTWYTDVTDVSRTFQVVDAQSVSNRLDHPVAMSITFTESHSVEFSVNAEVTAELKAAILAKLSVKAGVGLKNTWTSTIGKTFTDSAVAAHTSEIGRYGVWVYNGYVHRYHRDYQCNPYDDEYLQASAPSEEHFEWSYTGTV